MFNKLAEIYGRVPEVSCRACGRCCISPHISVIEFCYALVPLRENQAELERVVSLVVADHPDFPGQRTCRFQTADNLCSVHSHRPLACRLHGHPVLKEMGQEYDVHCNKTESLGRQLTPRDVYTLLDAVNDLNRRCYDHYAEPYWVNGFTPEVWLTIAVTPSPRPLFAKLREIIGEACPLDVLSASFTQTVALEEKLTLIEEFHRRVASGRTESIGELLNRIQNDFPDTGTYYYFEAEMYRKELQKRGISL